MLSIAFAMLKTRWLAFAGSFAALALGVSVIATMALVLATASDGDPHQRPQRFAAVPVVVRAEPALHVKDRYGINSTVPLPEQPALPSAIVARFPAAVADRTFYAQIEGGPASQVGHPWSAAAFTPYKLTAGRAPAGPGEIVVGGGPARLVGHPVTVLTGTETRTYTVSGVTAPVAFEHAIFFDDAEAARISPPVDALVPHAWVPHALVPHAWVPQGRVLAIPGIQLLTGSARHQADPGALQDSTDLTGLVSFLGVAALLSGFVSLYVTGSTFALSVAQRRHDLALLRTIGATPLQVTRMVCTEAALVGVAGSATGCALGLMGGPLMAGWMAHHGMAPAWFSVRLTAGSLIALVAAVAAGITVAVLSATVASARAAMIRPNEALREAAIDDKATSPIRVLTGTGALVSGVALLTGLVIFFPAGAADLKTNVTLVLLMITGTALLTPVFLPPLVRLATWPFIRRAAAGGMLIRAGVLAGLRRASAAVVPVLITVGLAAAVLGSIDTTNAAKNTELHRQAATADYVVIPSSAPGLTAPLRDRIHAIAGVEATAVTETTLVAHPPAITALHLEAPMPIPFPAIGIDAPGALNLRVLDGSLNGLDDRSVAVDTSWNTRVADTLNLWLADGTPVSLRVAAVLHPGLGGPGLLVSPHNAGRSLPTRMYLRLRPGADQAATRAALTTATHLFGAKVVPTARWTAAIYDHQAEQTRLGLVVLLGITIAYSWIGIANTFLMSVEGRKRELALLRLSGATRHQVLRIVSAQSLLLALVGIVLAAGVSAVVLAGFSIAYSGAVGPTPARLPWPAVSAIAAGGTLTAVATSALATWFALHTVLPSGCRVRRRVATATRLGWPYGPQRNGRSARTRGS